ncbi:MAG: hypothetical protein PPP58_04645 [Natronomonas sp.]
MSGDVDGDALRRYVEWVEDGRAEVEVYETPLGTKFSGNPVDGAPIELDGEEIESARAVMGVWEDVIVSIYEGDIEAVDEVDGEWWEEFVVVASEALEDVGEEELRAARDG